MKITKIIAICAVLLLATSCGSISKYRSYSFSDVRLEMGMNDLQYLGEQEISVEYTNYLGIYNSIETINGVTYDPTNKQELTIPHSGFRNQILKKASYKLVEKFPEADYFQIVFENRHKDKLFLGSTNKVRARVKAYKLKN